MNSAAIDVHIIENQQELETAFDIRRQVFMGEQGISEAEEFDGLDEKSTHYIANIAGTAAGSVRVRPLKKNEGGDVKIERLCVLKDYRGFGVGRKMMERILKDIKANGHKTVLLYGQTHAVGFYQSFGFKPFGDEFLDARIPHRRLKLEL